MSQSTTTSSVARVDLVPDGDLILALSGFRYQQPEARAFVGSVLSSYYKEDDPTPSEIQLRVTASHLKFVSKPFSVFLKPDSATQKAPDGSVIFTLDEDPGDAMLMLMMIVYGKARLVPQQLGLVCLYDVSVVIDKYMLHEAAELIMRTWAANMTPMQWQRINPQSYVKPATGYRPDPLAQIETGFCIAHVFRMNELFRAATKAYVWLGCKSLNLAGCPFPESLLGKINQARNDLVADFFKDLQDMLLYYMKGTLNLKRQCELTQNFSYSRNRTGPKECSAAIVGMICTDLYRSPTFKSIVEHLTNQPRSLSVSLRDSIAELEKFNWKFEYCSYCREACKLDQDTQATSPDDVVKRASERAAETIETLINAW